MNIVRITTITGYLFHDIHGFIIDQTKSTNIYNVIFLRFYICSRKLCENNTNVYLTSSKC